MTDRRHITTEHVLHPGVWGYRAGAEAGGHHRICALMGLTVIRTSAVVTRFWRTAALPTKLQILCEISFKVLLWQTWEGGIASSLKAQTLDPGNPGCHLGCRARVPRIEDMHIFGDRYSAYEVGRTDYPDAEHPVPSRSQKRSTEDAWRRRVTARDFHFVMHQLTSLTATPWSGCGHLCHMHEDSEAQRVRLPPRSQSHRAGVCIRAI